MIDPLLASGGLLDDLGINLKVWATQVVIFVATFLILSRLLFGRVLYFMRQREEEMRQGQETVARNRAEVERLAKEYDIHVARIDKEAYEKLQAALKEALAASATIVAKAQAESKDQVEKARQEIAREKQAAMGQLRTEIERLAVQVAEKVLDTKVGRN